MNKIKAFLSGFAVLLVISSIVCLQRQINVLKRAEIAIIHIETHTIPNNWECLTEAIIDVESGGDCMAANKNSQARGCMQIMPIYVAEINRLLGREVYTLNDRYDRDKSIEMFNLMNGFKNPKFNIKKAIELHNPNGGKEYYDKVMKSYNYFTKED